MITALACACTMALAQSAPAPDLAAQVRPLVRQLESAELAQRDQAEQALVQLGPAALPHLPEVTERTSAETGQRLGRVRLALEKQQAQAAGRATLVRYQAQGVGVSAALAEIARQTGNKLDLDPQQFDADSPEPKLDVDLGGVPFWEALDQVLDQAQLGVDEFAGDRALAIVPRSEERLPRSSARSIDGAFRVHAARVEAARDLQHVAGRSMRLYLRVAWEPRLRVVALVHSLEDLQLSAAGQAVEIDDAAHQLETLVNQGSTATELELSLEPPPRAVAKIDTVRVSLKALVLGPVETFRFAKLPAAKAGQANRLELTRAGVTVFVDQVRQNNDLWEVRTRVRFGQKSQSFESHLNWVSDNEAYLVGANRQRIDFVGMESTSTDEAEFGFAYLFADLQGSPEGLPFVYRTPVSVLEIPLKFELKDVDLP